MAQLPDKKKPRLVLDTNTFIKCLNLQDLNEKYILYTTGEVLEEIRDKKAREKFALLPFEIKSTWPSDDAIKFVKNFAKKTGDFTTLSETDIDLIALAYTFAKQNKTDHLLRREPPSLTEFVGTGNKADDKEIQEVIAHFKEKSEQNSKETENQKEEAVEKIAVEEQERKIVDESSQNLENSTKPNEDEKLHKMESEEQINEKEGEENENTKKKTENINDEDDEDDVEDDDEGWINPGNISKQLHKAQESKEQDHDIGVAIMTSDYAMQNVLLQIGIPVLSFDGLFIKQTKKFVLKCYACKRIMKETDKEFCSFCGNHTLTKVTCSINADGSVVYYLKKNYRVNTRGSIYPIPKKLGGRHQDLLLREDEFKLGGREFQKRKEDREKKKKWETAMYDYDVGVGFNLKQPSHEQKLEYGYGRRNPNDPKVFRTLKNKKK